MSLTPFNLSSDVVENLNQKLITSTWSGNTNDLNIQTSFTSSAQGGNDAMTSPTSSGMFHIEVYNTVTGSSAAEVQFSLAYGNRRGSGSPDFTNDTGSLGIGASRVIYGQYRNLVFENETSKFKFGNHTPDGIYVININRSRYKQRLSPGSLNLHLRYKGLSGTGSNSTIHLTDNSVTKGATVDNPNYDGTDLGGFYTIVSGSGGTRSGSLTNQVTMPNTSASCYGFIYILIYLY